MAPSHYLKQCWLFISKVQYTCNTHLRAISQVIPQPLITQISSKFTNLKFHSYPPEANEFRVKFLRVKVCVFHSFAGSSPGECVYLLFDLLDYPSWATHHQAWTQLQDQLITIATRYTLGHTVDVMYSFDLRCNVNDWRYLDGLVQESGISSVSALEIPESCAKPSVITFKQGKSEGFESCDRPLVRKGPIWVKIGDVLSRVTLKFHGWPWKTIGHLPFAVSSFLQHFIAICEFKVELQSGNAQFGSNSTNFRPVWP